MGLMKKKLSTYSNPKTHKKYNLLIKNNLKVKHNPKTAKFYYTGKDLSNLGFISSSGGSNINADYFNIFSKSALFDYDTAKKINEFCQTKKDLGEITYYNLKKRRILTEYMNFDNVDIIDNPFASSYTYIKRIVVSKLGEGIAYASTFDIFPGDIIGSGTCGTGCFLELNGSKITDNILNNMKSWLEAFY